MMALYESDSVGPTSWAMGHTLSQQRFGPPAAYQLEFAEGVFERPGGRSFVSNFESIRLLNSGRTRPKGGCKSFQGDLH